MIITRRSSDVASDVQLNERASSVALLERKPVNDVAVETKVEETYEQQQERMQKNLERLLNYDTYSQTKEAEKVVEDVVVSQPVNQEEDIRPTSTTMQFGDGDLDQMYKEMAVANKREKQYSLNAKGKFVIALYSLAVTLILALIVLNTGVLASLSNAREAKAQTLAQLQSESYSIQQEIDQVSSPEHIIKQAEDLLGMIKG